MFWARDHRRHWSSRMSAHSTFLFMTIVLLPERRKDSAVFLAKIAKQWLALQGVVAMPDKLYNYMTVSEACDLCQRKWLKGTQYIPSISNSCHRCTRNKFTVHWVSWQKPVTFPRDINKELLETETFSASERSRTQQYIKMKLCANEPATQND